MGWAVTKKKTISAQIKSRENVHSKKKVIEIHVGEAFQLTKSAAKLEIQVAQRMFLGVFAKDVNRPIIWDCSHGWGFAPVRTEIMFLPLWKVKLVPFKRSLAGNVVSVARIKKSQ